MTTIEITGPLGPRYDEILTPEALGFLARLHDVFAGRRGEELLRASEFERTVANGRDPRFLPETAGVRADRSWRVAGAGPGLESRRVEITGPTSRAMTVNALNSGADCWLADLEDATSPTWANIVEGQINLSDAIRRRIDFTTPEGRSYTLGERTATIIVRPRGWHLVEKHLTVIDREGFRHPASASLVDFGLYLFHNAKELIAAGRGAYFYLPKLANHRQARLWDDVFTFSENALGLEHGSIRATVLIETITAAFEMEEILYELRDHCAGLNAGRWDYLFSLIKMFRERGPRFVLPDRAQLTMTTPFMRAYTELLVSTCHRRGAFAIGGMSAFIPSRRDAEVNERALAQVSDDKRREAEDGFDGTWVAHPDLVPVARGEFDAVMGDALDQRSRRRDDVHVTGPELIDVASDTRVTDAGVRANVSIAIRYLDSWLRGIGAAALDNLMEDAATAEISRSQIWHWIRAGVVTASGTVIDHAHVESVISDVVSGLPRSDRLDDAVALFREVALEERYPAFLTTVAYSQYLVEKEAVPVLTSVG